MTILNITGNTTTQHLAQIIAELIWNKFAADFMNFSNDRNAVGHSIFIQHIGAFFEQMGEDIIRLRDGPNYTEIDTALFALENSEMVKQYIEVLNKNLEITNTFDIDPDDKSARINMYRYQ